MAVTLLGVPPTPATRNEFNVLFSQSSGGTLPEIRKAFYQLKQGGTDIGGKKVVDFFGSTIPANFSEIAKNFVRPSVPALSGTSAFEVTSMVKEFVIEYGERIINIETGEKTDEVQGTSPAIKYSFIGQSYHDQQSFQSKGYSVLSSRPKSFDSFEGQYDWLYIACGNSATVTVRATIRSATGGVTGSILPQSVSANTVKAFPVGYANFFGGLSVEVGGSAIFYINVNGSDVETYTVWFKGCTDSNFLNQLVWLEPKGGFSSMMFNDVASGIDRTFNSSDRYVSSSFSDVRSATTAISGLVSNETFTLKRKVRNDYDLQRFIKTIAASDEQYMVMKVGTQDVLIPVAVNAGGFEVLNTDTPLPEVTISGKFLTKMNA